jgi:hypothetical protein
VAVKLNAFLLSPPDGNEWPASCLNYFAPEKTAPRYSLDRKLSGPQSPSGNYGENLLLLLLGIKPQFLITLTH